ncbi:HEPN/Toprim-associated domain-containing protein [Aeromonas veronii]|uniref:HEPN/Toprim-associated domain-containing protein n=1 Tax=Aeromonas veronii TaxID=654 RepID=UPI0032F08100
MSSFSDIKINGHELECWQNSYYEWYFKNADRIREIRSFVDESGNDRFIGYRATARTIRRRLQLDGHTLESAKQDFDQTREVWINDMRDSLNYYEITKGEGSSSSVEFYETIKRQLETVKNTSFQEWTAKIIEGQSKRIEYHNYSFSYEEVVIENEPLLSLMLSPLFGVTDNNMGFKGSLFPCMELESFAIVLLDMCKDDDICELDITDIVDGGWVDDFEDIEQIQDGKTYFYKIFENSLIELTDINLDESTPVLQRMIFSSVITAMEAYLSDTLKKNVLNRDAIKKRFVKNSEHLKNSGKIFLNDIFDELGKLDEKIIGEIDKISFHNVGTVINLYKNVLLCNFPNDKKAQLSKSVEIRHDIVHRNGKTTDGSIIHIAKEDVENLIMLVSDVVSHIDKQILDGLLYTGNE